MDKSFPINVDAWTVGWGGINGFGKQSEVLKSVKIRVYNMSECSKIDIYDANSTYQICAGDNVNINTVCFGDSGGPLFIKETIGGKEKLVFVGVTSYGYDEKDKFCEFPIPS